MLNKPETPSRVILLVESTAAAAVTFKTARKWTHLLLRKVETKESPSNANGADQSQVLPKLQCALIVYGTCDRSTEAAVQSSGWCSSSEQLLEYLNGVEFVGGLNSKGTALTHALAQAIILSKCPYPDGSRPTAAGMVSLLPGSTLLTACHVFTMRLHYVWIQSLQ